MQFTMCASRPLSCPPWLNIRFSGSPPSARHRVSFCILFSASPPVCCRFRSVLTVEPTARTVLFLNHPVITEVTRLRVSCVVADSKPVVCIGFRKRFFHTSEWRWPMTHLIRLACQHCDTDECDGVTEIPSDWSDVQEVQSLAASQEPIAAEDQTRSVFEWYTHVGTCPECQKIYG